MPIEEKLNQEPTTSEQPIAEHKPMDKLDKIILVVVLAVSLIFLCSFLYKMLSL